MDRTSPYPEAEEDWPQRPWLLAAIGAVAGFAIQLIFSGEGESGWGAAAAAFLFFAALALGLALRRERLLETIVFSLGLGVVMGSIAFLAVDTGDRLAGEEFAFAAGVFFSILALPLFQAGFHRQRWATPYAETHFHVWTDAVSVAGAWAFAALSWLLLFLLDALFDLVGVDVIGELIETDWFAGAFIGATIGAALGILRNQLGIIGTLQRVVMLVLSLLAVPFAAGIVVFLVILLTSGGSALWEATDAATPVLLACAIGCFVLANVVVRDSDAARSSNKLLQAAALALAFAIFPLTVFAAISMGLRIDQHGLTPERIWALVAIAIATAYGLAYWVALVRGRKAGWAEMIRRANLSLAVATCAIALVLAFPLLDFGKIATQNQLARLERGEVSVEDFDYAALRWDFGAAGRAALARMAEGEGEVAELAEAAQAHTQRYPGMEERLRTPGTLAFAFDEPQLREWTETHVVSQPWICRESCVALDLGEKGGRRHVALVSRDNVEHLYFREDGVAHPLPPPAPARTRPPDDAPLQAGDVELRDYSGRQIYVDGEPVGDAFE